MEARGAQTHIRDPVQRRRGITPLKVDGAENPTSSVMIRRMFGAPLGSTTRAGQYGFDSTAFGLISPRKGCGGFGKYRPSMVVVAPGEPGAPLVSWACALKAVSTASKSAATIAPTRQ